MPSCKQGEGGWKMEKNSQVYRFVLICLSIGVGLATPLLALEVALRFMPVNEGLRTLPVNEQNPVRRFQPNRTSTWSRGWNFRQINSVHSNNYGFLNDIDYSTTDPRPLVAIIGDSYIEAAMVPYKETSTGIVQRELSPAMRVYSFGASGSALSDYLVYARYARKLFQPNFLIVLVVGNDFDESFTEYNDEPGRTYFANTLPGEAYLERRNFEPSILRKIVQHSALAMYLSTNVQVGDLIQPNWTFSEAGGNADAPRYLGNTAFAVDSSRLRDSRTAVDKFLSALPEASGLPTSKILIAVDGNRELIYGDIDEEIATVSFFGKMRTYVLAKSLEQGFRVLDLETVFSTAYASSKNRFEWQYDWHWNSTGHAVFAEALVLQIQSEIHKNPPSNALHQRIAR